jgi:hypothetical protein
LFFTDNDIGEALGLRGLMDDLRQGGVVTGGPAPMTPKDRSRFLSKRDDAVNAAHRAHPTQVCQRPRGPAEGFPRKTLDGPNPVPNPVRQAPFFFGSSVYVDRLSPHNRLEASYDEILGSLAARQDGKSRSSCSWSSNSANFKR